MVVEGVTTTKAAYELAALKEVDMPITNAIYDVIYNHQDVREVIDQLMNRVGKNETD